MGACGHKTRPAGGSWSRDERRGAKLAAGLGCQSWSREEPTISDNPLKSRGPGDTVKALQRWKRAMAHHRPAGRTVRAHDGKGSGNKTESIHPNKCTNKRKSFLIFFPFFLCMDFCHISMAPTVNMSVTQFPTGEISWTRRMRPWPVRALRHHLNIRVPVRSS